MTGTSEWGVRGGGGLSTSSGTVPASEPGPHSPKKDPGSEAGEAQRACCPLFPPPPRFLQERFPFPLPPCGGGSGWGDMRMASISSRLAYPFACQFLMPLVLAAREELSSETGNLQASQIIANMHKTSTLAMNM